MDLEKGCIFHSFDGGRCLRFLKMAVFFIVLTAIGLYGSWFLAILMGHTLIVDMLDGWQMETTGAHLIEAGRWLKCTKSLFLCTHVYRFLSKAFYENDPFQILKRHQVQNLNVAKQNVLGGESVLWVEQSSEGNILSKVMSFEGGL